MSHDRALLVASGSRFVAEGRAMVAEDDRTRGEFFVAPLYGRMVDAGAHVRADVALEVAAMGTPSELAEFERWMRDRPAGHV